MEIVYIFTFFIQKLLLESGDSTRSENNQKEHDKTPCSKVNAKRTVEDVEPSAMESEKGSLSTTKRNQKLAKVKTEKLE